MKNVVAEVLGFLRKTTSHRVVDLSTYHARLDVCDGCEFRDALGICSRCGCILVLKAGVAGMDCPLGKWPANPTPAPSP